MDANEHLLRPDLRGRQFEQPRTAFEALQSNGFHTVSPLFPKGDPPRNRVRVTPASPLPGSHTHLGTSYGFLKMRWSPIRRHRIPISRSSLKNSNVAPPSGPCLLYTSPSPRD